MVIKSPTLKVKSFSFWAVKAYLAMAVSLGTLPAFRRLKDGGLSYEVDCCLCLGLCSISIKDWRPKEMLDSSLNR